MCRWTATTGIPQLKIRIRPALAQTRLLAYLHGVDEFSVGKLITHGARSVH